MRPPEHKISVGFGIPGSDSLFVTTEDVMSYSVSNDMLATADSFSLNMPLKKELWDMARPDAAVTLHIDGTRVLKGFVDARIVSLNKSGGGITVNGRDKGGRLVDESAPYVKFGGKGIENLAKSVVGTLFKNVTLKNTENRALITGLRGEGVSRSEPAVLARRDVRHQTRPGETKAQVMNSILEQAELMAWSSADGESYFVGNPTQKQKPLWHWFVAAPNSRRSNETNVLDVRYSEDFGESYSLIRVVGVGRGDRVNFGRNVTGRFGEATSDYEFSREKVLVLPDSDIDSAAEAKQRAEREMAERDTAASALEITVPGHGQNGLIYAFDTVGRFEFETIGLAEDFYVTRVEFRGQREDAHTVVSLVPVGTDLRVNG